MTNLLSRLLFVLLPIGAATAKEKSPVVELYNHVSGPAIETHSLRLMEDGTVVSETYDWRKSGKGYPHNLVVLCRLTSAQKEAAVSQAEATVSDLSRTVKAPRFVSIDGPYKTIEVTTGGKSIRSTLYDPESNGSAGAQDFHEAWAKLTADLNSQR